MMLDLFSEHDARPVFCLSNGSGLLLAFLNGSLSHYWGAQLPWLNLSRSASEGTAGGEPDEINH